MALNYGIKQPLRIYENNDHRNKYLLGGDLDNFRLLCPLNRLVPFEIKRDTSLFSLTYIKLMDDKTGAFVLDLITHIQPDEIAVFSFATYDYIVHYGSVDHLADIEPGKYFLEISDGLKTWYTETLFFVNFNPDTLAKCAPTKFVFWNDCDVADIFYRTIGHKGKQYKNIFYLDIDIGRPIYDIREEGDEDTFGELTIEYAVSEKKYLLQGVFPQYFLDMLALLPLHYNGEIEISTYRGYTEKVNKISIDPKWQGTDAAIALTDILITTDTAIQTSCCNSLEAPTFECLKEAFLVEALIVSGTSNYTNFEYTDSLTGLQVPLVHGDRVLLKIGADTSYRFYNSAGVGSYDLIGSFVEGDGLIDLNQQKALAPTTAVHYLYKAFTNRWITKPSLSVTLVSGNTYKASGSTWRKALVELWENVGGTFSRIAVGSGQNYISLGFTFEKHPAAISLYVKAVGLNCVLGQSLIAFWGVGGIIEPLGIGDMVIGDSFQVADNIEDS